MKNTTRRAPEELFSRTLIDEALLLELPLDARRHEVSYLLLVFDETSFELPQHRGARLVLIRVGLPVLLLVLLFFLRLLLRWEEPPRLT